MYDVITIGTATRDVFLQSSLFKVLKDPKHLERLGFPTGEAQCFAFGSKMNIDKPIFTIGGGAANAGVTLARQGFKTAALIKVGQDDIGNGAIETLKEEGVTPIVLREKNGLGTAWSCILLSSEGERTILSYRGASEDVKKEEIPFKKISARWTYIVPGKIPFEVIRGLVRELRKNGTAIAMNPSKFYLDMGMKKLQPILSQIDIILLNREEAADLTGFRYNEEKKIFKRFAELARGLAIMTDGPKGVLVSDGRKIYKAGIYKEKVLADRTGAGDSFGSGFLAGIMRKSGKKENINKEAIAYAIRLGSANSTSNVEQIGSQTGILRKGQFEKEKRWKNLTIHVSDL